MITPRKGEDQATESDLTTRRVIGRIQFPGVEGRDPATVDQYSRPIDQSEGNEEVDTTNPLMATTGEDDTMVRVELTLQLNDAVGQTSCVRRESREGERRVRDTGRDYCIPSRALHSPI